MTSAPPRSLPSSPPSPPSLLSPPLPSAFAKQVGHTKNVTIGLAKVGQLRFAKIGLCTPDDARQINGNDKSSNATHLKPQVFLEDYCTTPTTRTQVPFPWYEKTQKLEKKSKIEKKTLIFSMVVFL